MEQIKNQRILEIYNKIEELNQEKDEIQNGCVHNETEIVDYMWRIGSSCKAEHCLDCGYISTKKSFEIK